MSELEFATEDDRYGTILGDEVVRSILDHCVRAGRHETGGILVGRYSPDMKRAIVASITGPPKDSRSSRSQFLRGIQGLQHWLDRLWSSKEAYYLGEWHFHPFSSPDPSPTDVTQMKSISMNCDYRCPEPILLIIGGDPTARWSIRAFVFVGARQTLELSARSVAPKPFHHPAS